MKTVYQKIIFVLGIIFVALAVVGTLLPIMPTVPFLLLAAACFNRSSPRFHQALVNHAHFGPLIRDFYAGKGIPRRAKYISITMIWTGFIFSLFILPGPTLKIFLALILTAVTGYLLSLKTSDGGSGNPQNRGRPGEVVHSEEE